jgi:hypothetical protein
MGALLASLCLALLVAGAGSTPSIGHLKVTVEGQQVKVGFALQNAFDEDLRERIQSGLPTGFIYRFQLQKARKIWFDNTVQKSKLEVVAIYDAVTRDYRVDYKLNDKLIESRAVHDPEELELAMTRFEALPVLELKQGAKRERAFLRVRAELGSRVRFLLLPTKIATDWVVSDRLRAP